MKGILALGLAGALMLGVSPSPAQKNRLDKRTINDEIQVARNLAVDFGFLNLANELLDKLLEIPGLSEDLRNSIKIEKLLLKIYNALAKPNLETKLELLRPALAELGELMGRHRQDDMGTQVRIQYGRYAMRFCDLLNEKLEQPNLMPATAQELKKEGEEVCRGGIKALNEAKAYTRDGSNQHTEAWYTLCNFKMKYAYFSTTEAERDLRLDQAIQELEDFIFAKGMTPIGIQALLLTAQCNELKKDFQGAEYIYSSTKEDLWNLFQDENHEIPPQAVPRIAAIMEDAYSQSMRLLLGQEADPEKVVEQGREMLSRVQQLEVELALPEGYQALYYFVRALTQMGEYDEALKRAMEGAEKCGTHMLASRFRSLIEEIIPNLPPGAQLDPDIIYQVARSKYSKGQYKECITFSKKALAFLQTDQQKGEYGLELFRLMGLSYEGMERRVEATFAFGEGCDLFGRYRAGDDKYANKLELASIRCKGNADRAWRNAQKAPTLEPLVQYGNRIYKDHTKDPGRIIYNEMKAALEAGNYTEVEIKFKQLKPEFSIYEQGMALIVEMAFDRAEKSGNYIPVKKAAADYLEKYLSAHPHVAGEKLENRRLARMQVNFILGRTAYNEAIGDSKLGLQPDPAMWDRVIEVFRPFPANYPGQHEFLAYAYYAMGRAWKEKGDLDKAEANFSALKQLKKRGVMVTVLAMQIFLGHKERIDALEATPRETEESRAELAGALRKALNFGQLYLKSNPNPDWAILRPMLDYRMELEDVDGTLRLLSTMEGLFGQKPSGREKLIKWVIPEVVDFLLKRKEFNRAAPLVEKMLQRKSYPQEVRWNAIKFYAGWLVVENGQVKEVNGHGPIEKAYQALEGGESLIELLYKPYQSADSQFTQGWYRVVAQYSYVYLQAGAEDTALFEKAKKFVSKVKGIDNFKKIIEHPRLSELEQKKLDELGPEEKKKKLAEYEAEREELYKIFQYLARKLGV